MHDAEDAEHTQERPEPSKEPDFKQAEPAETPRKAVPFRPSMDSPRVDQDQHTCRPNNNDEEAKRNYSNDGIGHASILLSSAFI